MDQIKKWIVQTERQVNMCLSIASDLLCCAMFWLMAKGVRWAWPWVTVGGVGLDGRLLLWAAVVVIRLFWLNLLHHGTKRAWQEEGRVTWTLTLTTPQRFQHVTVIKIVCATCLSFQMVQHRVCAFGDIYTCLPPFGYNQLQSII